MIFIPKYLHSFQDSGKSPQIMAVIIIVHLFLKLTLGRKCYAVFYGDDINYADELRYHL